MKKLLKIHAAWTPVWTVGLLMLCMISVYLPVFGGPSNRLTNFPLIIVNEDMGSVSFSEGKDIVDNLVNTHNGHTFKWKMIPNRELAIRELKNNQAYGALIIPANFSQSISELHNALMTGQPEGKAANLEILINEGGTLSTTTIATNLLETITTAVSGKMKNQLLVELTKNKIQLSPTIASLMDNPIQIATTNVLGLPENVNKGMTPFILILISSISGLMGVNMVNGYLKNISAKLRSDGKLVSKTEVLLTGMVLGVILAALVALISQLAVFGVFGSAHSTSIWLIFLFSLLCCLTLYFQFKIISLLLGSWGILVMFPINILGIFTSGGAVPLTTLPFIHHFFSSFLPTRYMVDGLRVLLYYNGRLQAGLGTALFIIIIYFVIYLGSCLAFAYRTYQKESLPIK